MRNSGDSVTIKDIAADVGVSVATVSRVINRLPSVSKGTVAKVQEAMERLGYRPLNGNYPRKASLQNSILLLLPTISNPFYSTVVGAITRSMTLVGYDVELCVSDYSMALEKTAFQRLVEGKYRGLISFSAELPAEYLQKISDNYPYVMVSHHVEGLDATCVSIDDQKAMYEATEYLIQQGHTKLALISGTKGGDVLKERGFSQAKQAYGLEANPAHIVRSIRQYGFEFEMGSLYCEDLLNTDDPPTAILSVFDAFAIGAAKYALSKGIRVGREFGIIGFDNAPFSKIFSPSISSVAHPLNELGITAADLLLNQIQTGDYTPKRVYLPHELIIRDSSQ